MSYNRELFAHKAMIGLNPCCNGIYSMRLVEYILYQTGIVLILVVMEYTQ